MPKESVPSWLVKRYMKLWDKFKEKEFSFDGAKNTLKEEGKFVSVVLSKMKNEGWLSLELDPNDARRRLYKLKQLEEVMAKTADKALNVFREESERLKTNISISNLNAGRDVKVQISSDGKIKHKKEIK